MVAKIIDGRQIAEDIKLEIAKYVQERIKNKKNPPGLATVLVGENPASKIYIRAKHKACEEVGIKSFSISLPEDVSQEEVENTVKRLNADPLVNGILVQLPLPNKLDEEKILSNIQLDKDVDGFHPVNIGRLAQKKREPYFIPCTPAGIMVLLSKAGASFQGEKAVVLGRSNIVGMPISLLLLRADATVTICHSRTKDLRYEVQQANIVIAAIGRANTVKADWIKPGAIVIDVGMNRVSDSSAKRGYRLVGDVDFLEVSSIAGAITPVPGGVGPMTIAMLLKNTLRATEIQELNTL